MIFIHLISVIGAICTIIMFFLSYWYILSKGSLRAVRKKISNFVSDLSNEQYKPDLAICLGRGGFFVGSLLTDMMDRSIPVIGIDKAYYTDGEGDSRIRLPRIEVPKCIVLSDQYSNPNILLVTGEIVDGISMKVAVDFLKKNIPNASIRTYSVYWSYNSSFKPNDYTFAINGRQKRLPWKKEISPSASDYPQSRMQE